MSLSQKNSQIHMPKNILKQINSELKKNIDPIYKAGSIKFFKEKINPIGVRTPIVRRIAKQYYPKDIHKTDLFLLCETLLKNKTMEETIIAFQWVRKKEKEFEKKDFILFSTWIKKYVTNWAFCDDFCTHAFGSLIYRQKELLPKIFAWTTSKNRWQRRAAAVTLIYLIKKKDKNILTHVYATADALLTDPDDLVQKGYGWMLKEASNIWPANIFHFVMKRKDTMPRTALRYAIEKYPKEMKQEAMK
jgi:3-methyladenine DNA glycosylase AlkD